MFRLHGRTLAALVWVSVGMACGDASTAPLSGTIRVTTRTTGGDPDNDGYTVVLNTGTQRVILGSVTEFAEIPPGAYTVMLQGVAANCSVSGDSSRPVTVTAGEIAAVSFDVVCAATGIDITIHATGRDIPNSYRVMLGSESIPLDADSSVVVGRLQPGSYTITLAPPSPNCSVAGGLQVTIDVVLRSVTNVLFDITCAPMIRPEKIAFAFDTTVDGVTQSWIGLVNSDGTGRTTLVRGDSPAWSRFGDKVVFSSLQCYPLPYYGYLDCLGGLAFIDPETGNRSSVTERTDDLGPSWSPTSDVIAFWRSPGTLFFLSSFGGSSAIPLPVAGVVSARDPAWAPDGRRLAFTCEFPEFPAHSEICIYDPDAPLVHFAVDVLSSRSQPAWSPDGSRIAFTAYAPHANVAVADARGGGASFLTHGLSADWSRDGTKLVFADSGGLYTINADGSNRTLLTSGPLHAPAWRR